MIQRTLLEQSRALSQHVRPLSVYTKLYAHFPPIRISTLRPRILAPRCYSIATESNNSSASSELPPSGTSSEEDPRQKELDTKNREIIDLKDKYLRSVADFRNLQDRTKRDIDTARNFAISRFARDLIESVDNLDRALSIVNPASVSPPNPSENSTATTTPSPSSEEGQINPELDNLYQGLKMTEGILMSTLKKHGLERFDPSIEGEKFDPNLHDAAFMTKVEGKPDGSVFETIQKGFLLNGRVVRAAKVGVVKND
ncbi:MAG: hypothetical protein Q9164_000414 [Protoblastenia rupestris]